MWKCHFCNRVNEDDDDFCAACGHRHDERASVEPTQHAEPQKTPAHWETSLQSDLTGASDDHKKIKRQNYGHQTPALASFLFVLAGIEIVATLFLVLLIWHDGWYLVTELLISGTVNAIVLIATGTALDRSALANERINALLITHKPK